MSRQITLFKNINLQQTFLQLPEKSGVYFFKNINSEILYVGKANNLRKRVASYAKPKNDDWKAQGLIENAVRVEFRVTNNPVEALLFEAQLIQAHQPRYNILLKSGAPYVYFLFTEEDIPELLLVRDKTQAGVYFGPFLQRGQAKKIYDFLLNNFVLRICHKKIASGCMFYHIGQCAGSCMASFDVRLYKQRLSQIKMLLEKGPEALIKDLEIKIKKAIQKLEFETAQILERQLLELQKASPMLACAGIVNAQDSLQKNTHIWLLWPNNQALQLFSAHQGLVISLELWFSPKVGFDAEIAQQYMKQYYFQVNCPNSIFTNFIVDEKVAVEHFLSQWHKKIEPIAIVDRVGSIPPDAVILAQETVNQSILALKQTPMILAKLMGGLKPIKIIDCFDISHNQGHFMVGAAVRFIDGKISPKDCRRFKIKTVLQQDDYACLREVVASRYNFGTKDLPDLVLIDGGKGQRNAVLDLVGATPLAALAKQEERVFCASNKTSGIKLNLQEPHAALLIALRDATHSFAINFHRKLFRSELKK